ncbi:MAG: hypothetical protein MZV63_00995 [Marinilabiliales bacterium]|nr:hypothetical protein [Marinilabiliales bacterium]
MTKTRTPEEAMEAYNAGLRIFGENRVQEMATKKTCCHRIYHGTLSVTCSQIRSKQAVAAASVIESVDTVRLLRIIDAEASAQGKTIDCLLQLSYRR